MEKLALWLIIGGAALVTALLFFGAACSQKLKRRDYSVESPKIKNGFTIAHISDLHECLFGKGQSKLIEAVRNARPDIIVVTGDIVEDGKPSPRCGKILSEDNNARLLLEKLPGIAPTYMVFGNHEGNIPMTDTLAKEIEALGIHLLHRRNPGDSDMTEEASINGEAVLICGVDDPYFDRCERSARRKKLSERFREDKDKRGYGLDSWRRRLTSEYGFIKNESRLTFLLSHRPEEYELYRELGFDAAFSGHAHGGQWRLPPFINGVYAPNQGIFPRHAGGIYRYDGFAHIVSRGLSKKRMIRIFNRPEVCIVKFSPSL